MIIGLENKRTMSMRDLLHYRLLQLYPLLLLILQ